MQPENSRAAQLSLTGSDNAKHAVTEEHTIRQLKMFWSPGHWNSLIAADAKATGPGRALEEPNSSGWQD